MCYFIVFLDTSPSVEMDLRKIVINLKNHPGLCYIVRVIRGHPSALGGFPRGALILL
jgi:hypothetical protein